MLHHVCLPVKLPRGSLKELGLFLADDWVGARNGPRNLKVAPGWSLVNGSSMHTSSVVLPKTCTGHILLECRTYNSASHASMLGHGGLIPVSQNGAGSQKFEACHQRAH